MIATKNRAPLKLQARGIGPTLSMGVNFDAGFVTFSPIKIIVLSSDLVVEQRGSCSSYLTRS